MLLISDANILIDMESAELLEVMFQLPMRIAIPDILYKEEIEPETPGLEAFGLSVLEISGEYMEYAYTLTGRYGNGPSHNDYLALALAKQEGCPLLTGDKQLRNVALSEEISTMGTIWLLRTMVEHQILTVQQALEAIEKMKNGGRRLPWAEAERILKNLK